VHTFMVPGFPMSTENQSVEYQLLSSLYKRQQPRSYLYHGVTQLVDLAAHGDLLEPFNASPVHPHVLHCGAAPLATGYPTMFSRDASLDNLFPYHIIEPDDDDASRSETDADQTPERVVARMHDEGAVCVKLFFEDGFGPHTHWPLLSDDSVQRVIQAARERNMRVVAHANALEMQVAAAQFDIDVIAHGLWNWDEYRRESSLPKAIAEHLDDLQAKGIQFQPTMGVIAGIRALFDEEVLADPRLQDVVPKHLIDWYATPDGRWFKDELVRDEGWEGMSDKKIRASIGNPINKGEQVVDYLAKQGHPLLLASDTPSSPTYGNQPGLNTLLELQSMHQAGVSLDEVLRAATINNAMAFGVDQDYGTVETGKVANLLLLESNPLESIDAYDAIRYVIVDGSAYEREEFSARNAN